MIGSNSFGKKWSRRTVLSGAIKLGGAAALSMSAPALSVAASPTEGSDAASSPSAAMSGIGDLDSSKAIDPRPHFSREFLANKMFSDDALSFDQSNKFLLEPGLANTGALVQENGDVVFRIYAPYAKEVEIKFDLMRIDDLTLQKRSDGVFESVLKFDGRNTGPLTVKVYVDGMYFLYPAIPLHWSASSPRNHVEIPDPDLEFAFINDNPHGAVSREIYWSKALSRWARCMVYTPPGYMNSSSSFPVLYLQHGGGENETVWTYAGRAAQILDNLISRGESKPFLIVMNNDMVRYPNTPPRVIDLGFERMLLQDCIPYIEKQYRVRPDKWNRAIAGTSMGCMMSCDIAFRHPEIFGNLGTFNASMIHDQGSFNTTYERPYPRVITNPQKFGQDYKVYFRSTMPLEDHFPYFLADDKLCAENGIDKLPIYHRIVYPDRTSKWNGWRMGLRDFSKLLFL